MARMRIQAIKWCGYDIAYCSGQAWAFNFNGTKEVGPIGFFKDIKEAAKYVIRDHLDGLVPEGFPRKDDKTRLSKDLRKVVENDVLELYGRVADKLIEYGVPIKRG